MTGVSSRRDNTNERRRKTRSLLPATLVALLVTAGIAAGMLTPRVEQASAAGVFSVVSYGARSNDATDDTAAINRAVAAASAAGGGVAYVPAGVYLIDSVTSVRMKSNVTLRLDTGATLRAIPNSSQAYGIVTATNVSNVIIEGGVLQGERYQHKGTTGEWGHVVRVLGSTSVTLRNFTAKEGWGDGVYIGAYGSTPSRNVTVSGVTAAGNRRNGLSATALNGALITKSKFLANSGTPPQAGLDLEPNAGGRVENVTIEDSLADRNPGFGFLLYGAAGPVTKVTLRNSASTNGGKWPIAFHVGTSYCVSDRNTMTGNAVNSVYNQGSNNTVIPAGTPTSPSVSSTTSTTLKPVTTTSLAKNTTTPSTTRTTISSVWTVP